VGPLRLGFNNESKGVSVLAASNVNVVVITGNLTRDPELRHTGGGTAICELRVAVNSRRKDGQSGEWVDKANYFDVTVWGAQGENCANYLSKGRPVAIEGRLDWREWEAKDGSGKRQAVQIIANTVQFLGSRDGSGGGGGGNGNGGGGFTPQSDVPADNSDFEAAPAAAGASEDDIPF
jgi:single-strand DNA-binding protein